MKQKVYIIKRTINGFIIRFDHDPKGYKEENQMVAKTAWEIMDIIKKDIINESKDELLSMPKTEEEINKQEK